MKIPVLEGNIVCLRSVEPEKDYRQWYEVMKDPDMHRWTANTIPKDSNEMKELLHTYKNLKDIIAWSIITKHTKEMVGTYWISVPTVDENKKLIVSAESQRIARKFWRTGVNREARNLIYNYLFLTLDVDEIRAQAWDNNINSCRSMEQIGFKLENQVKRLFPKYNELFLENHYVLFKEDWFG
ncbi:GNAT family N-acetyltransferase [Bacillus tropicus]|uniref:GNAT family N-acetyltransferase n=1 Tax=Bacillus cereus group TaxID=86661 RepID=UPI000CD96846|nr:MULTISPECIES: GNAT family N-acetyltransferase [Bacillus cereus group]MCC2339103.1 GNAT family N-acetyltransferase [Bacillus tropicus]MCU5421773.1 GNAT family N-acetyltransferase [Bacillus tropicus]MDA1779462.1 GNAT family N-acetyltransferase [Bacillus cereus group sp. BY9-3LC]MDA1801502.1 GNAT family N-acetyltransferase [Bacillus cereus group sp. BY6-1LC]